MKMLPRLQAEEAIAAIEVAQLAGGGYEPADARRRLGELRDKAQGRKGEEPKPRRRADAGQLACIGIGVRSVPSQKAVSGV